jgi:hypothetical protein
MTEAAIDSGGAVASAEPAGAVLTPETATHNNPIHATMPEKEPVKVEKPISASDAIKAAQEKVLAKEAQPKTEAKVEATPEKPRAEDGKFSPKDAKPDTGTAEAAAKAKSVPEPVADSGQSEGRTSRYEAPARFNEQGKSEWAKVPEPVQAEVHRTIKNLEDGYAKHKESAERFELVKEYDDLARKNGRAGVHESLKQVVEIEQAFARNPIEGMKRITDHFGLNLQAVAAHIMGENPNQQVQEAHTRIRELEAKIQHMETAAKVPEMVAEFATKNERFEELSDVIATLLKTGTAKDLESAYELATVLRPVAASSVATQVQASSAAEPASPAPVLPKPAGQKSISGAPSSGATSGGKKRILSPSEALKAAMAQA